MPSAMRPVASEGDDLGEEWVVVPRHHVAFLVASVDADSARSGQRTCTSRPVEGKKPDAGSSA